MQKIHRRIRPVPSRPCFFSSHRLPPPLAPLLSDPSHGEGQRFGAAMGGGVCRGQLLLLHLGRPRSLGFNRSSLDLDDASGARQRKEAEAAWKSQKAWEVAQSPFKNLLMMGFMMWMAGNAVHLFSIGITFSALWQPISALQGVGKVFEPYKDPRVDILAPKLLFIALTWLRWLWACGS
uniref:ER membrane protein complex subunit 4 n=1 Tax=Ananas comosus var. bracteatus TaxID=296719 RepID=A0A6V7QAY7_ANACO|nr:unnamed protein product [Ananas comosus var. bracteatus]